MARPYLFGPIANDFADQNLRAHIEAGSCTVFGHDGALAAQPGDTWDNFASRLPDGCRPEFLVLQLQYNTIPEFLWRAPMPIVGLAGDWNLLWHLYRYVVPRTDLLLTDTIGVETFARTGITHAWPAHLFGCQRAFVEEAYPDEPRDIDILFVGNFHAVVQRERLPWLGRVARMNRRWNVHFTTNVYGDEYRKLLGRARIVFNRSIRGECNSRVFEAIVGGALLFQETENREIRQLLREREEFVSYDDANLEERLEHYLAHEDERRRIVENASKRRQEFTFEALWEHALATIEGEWPLCLERAKERQASPPTIGLKDRIWQAVSNSAGSDPALTAELLTAVKERPGAADLQNALGIALYHQQSPDGGAIANAFQAAWISDPRRLVAGLNLAEILVALGRQQDALHHAQRVLAFLEEGPVLSPTDFGVCHLPGGFGELRSEWERAGWSHAGNPTLECAAKTRLIRWALLNLIAKLTGDAVVALRTLDERPDLATAQANAGHALGRAQRPADACPHLEAALAGNPFDNVAANGLRELYQVQGRFRQLMRLGQDRLRLHRAAPGLVPLEPWFAEAEWVPPTSPQTPSSPLRIRWQGDQLPLHSLALVNRELSTRLLARGHELSLHEPPRNTPDSRQAPLSDALRLCLAAKLSAPANVQVNHQWPPDFAPPAEGHWVIIQPWEFGSIPKAWVGPLSNLVDEVWVPSRFVRNSYISSGVPADQVQIVPNGVSDVYFDEHPPYSLRTQKPFKFLFVGGTIQRKGFDVLLTAYGQAFTDQDDVCLIVKDMGVGTFYQGQTAEQMIAKIRERPHAPEIEYFSDELSPTQMAGLYRACNCLVHPYRGEGFGLPIAEAMASGLPVIVTGFGAALDFCSEETAYLIPATVETLDRGQGNLETVNVQYWARPDVDYLRYLMRHVVDHPDEARAKAICGQQHLRKHFTWDHAVSAVEERLHVLRTRPVRRLRITEPVMPTIVWPAAGSGKPRVSLTMIVKNEEHNLGDCLRSVADLVDEIVIADTGSSDRTKEIAHQFGAKVVDFPWIDSFAAARNEALRHATGDWIFWMDADDRLDGENRDRLRRLFTKLPHGQFIGYDLKVSCVPGPGQDVPTVVDHIRLFPNHPQIRWKYRIHEQILGAIRNVGGSVAWTDIVVQHMGYQDKDIHRMKGQRNHRLLQLDYQDDPNDPYTLFNLGNRLHELGKLDEAIDLLTRSLRLSHPTDSIVRKLYSLIAQCQQQQGRHDAALATCREGRGHYPNDVELLTVESGVLHRLGDRAGAIACLQKLRHSYEDPHFGSVNSALRGHVACTNLGILLTEDKRFEEAEEHFRLAVAEAPEHVPAWLGLGDLYLKQQRFGEVTNVLDQLGAIPHSQLDRSILQAQLALAQKRFDEARTILHEVIHQAPGSVFAKLVLARVYLQEGRDMQAAEQALRDVLALDPQHEEARINLEVLLRQKDRRA